MAFLDFFFSFTGLVIYSFVNEIFKSCKDEPNGKINPI